MRVSVAICTYNGARYLEPQLKSILGQTRPPDEIVLRDDGSSDGTLELAGSILRSFAGRVDMQRNEQRLGVSRNFEGTIRACTGDAVFLSDQDDVWMPEKVDVMAGILERDSTVSWLFSNGSFIDGQGDRVPGRLWDKFGLGLGMVERFLGGGAFSELLRAPRLTGATMAFRRRAALLALPVRDGWVHDHWMSLVLAGLGERVAAVDQPLIGYRIHSSQEIGIRSTSIGFRIRKSRSVGRVAYEREAEEAEALLAHIRSRAQAAGLEMSKERERHALSKIRHLRARARMRSSAFPAAVASVLAELAAGRYRYSFSSYAFLKDLLRI